MTVTDGAGLGWAGLVEAASERSRVWGSLSANRPTVLLLFELPTECAALERPL